MNPNGSARTWRKLVYLLAPLLLVPLAAGALVAGATPLVVAAAQAPNAAWRAWESIPVAFQDPPLPQRSVMLAADGSEIAVVMAYNRVVVPLDEVSPYVIDALLATEDARFYEHNGVDVRGTLRAASSMASGGQVQGGSTLTQQYVKNANLLAAELSGDADAMRAATEQTLWRKLVEAKTALALENSLTKDEILDRYLNIVNFGSGAYGIEAAAQRYFSTSSADLNPAQAATLVGILKAPTTYSPLSNPQASLTRRNLVLSLMANSGSITPAQARKFANTPLRLRPSTLRTGCMSATPAWGLYCEQVLSQLETDPTFGATEKDRAAFLAAGGLRIRTFLDTKATANAVAAMRAYVPSDDRTTLTAVVVQPGTGEVPVLAMNRQYGLSRGRTVIPLASIPWASPGSTFKAFTAAAAFEEGISVDTILPGGSSYTSSIFENPASGAFNNYDLSSASNVTIREAMRRSLNTAFVQLQEQVGTKAVADVARRMGVTSLPEDGPNQVTGKEGSLTLGAREVSTQDMAVAYATIASGGVYCSPRFVDSVTTSSGTITTTPNCQRVLDPSVAATLADVLTEPVSPGGTGTSANFDGREIAGKTGTAQGNSALWFVGFTPQYAMAVAMADPRGPAANPLDYYNSAIPDLVFAQHMAYLHTGLPQMPIPDVDDRYLTAPGPASPHPALPSVVGLSVADAQAILAPWSLDERLVPAPPGVRPGSVVALTPRPGTRLAPGSSVTIDVAQ